MLLHATISGSLQLSFLSGHFGNTFSWPVLFSLEENFFCLDVLLLSLLVYSSFSGSAAYLVVFSKVPTQCQSGVGLVMQKWKESSGTIEMFWGKQVKGKWISKTKRILGLINEE